MSSHYLGICSLAPRREAHLLVVIAGDLGRRRLLACRRRSTRPDTGLAKPGLLYCTTHFGAVEEL